MLIQEKLPRAKAGYDDHISGVSDRTSCFKGTREQLLTDIKAWIHDPNRDNPIYVLYGIAGIGKTTLAQTVAEYAASLKLLGASFFFSGAEDNCKSGGLFFPTLAFQLALHDAHIGAHIATTLRAKPNIWDKTLALQIQHLVVEPIRNAGAQTPLILVVDALDECLPLDAKSILNLLAQNIQSMPNVKIFLTARPESYIETLLKAKGNFQPFYLHEIEPSIAKHDIKLFLEHALSKEEIVRVRQYNDWEPTREELKSLAEYCGILFIMASTAVKYISTAYQPALQMRNLLDGLYAKGKESVIPEIDRMYLTILKSSVPEGNAASYFQNFQTVVGAIIVLENPLGLPSLANFLGMTELEVQRTLEHLHSILAPVSTNQTPQLYHKSFSDFVTSNKHCRDIQFYIIPHIHHANAVQFCFDLMDKALHFNMYDLQGLQRYMTNAEIVEKRLSRGISDELRYACMYWAVHLSKAGDIKSEELIKSLHEFAFTHLLHWIEVLSLIGKLEIAYFSLNNAKQVLVSSLFRFVKHELSQR